MNIFKEALTWFKANNRKIEKISLLVGSLILLVIGLFYNIYAVKESVFIKVFFITFIIFL